MYDYCSSCTTFPEHEGNHYFVALGVVKFYTMTRYLANNNINAQQEWLMRSSLREQTSVSLESSLRSDSLPPGHGAFHSLRCLCPRLLLRNLQPTLLDQIHAHF